MGRHRYIVGRNSFDERCRCFRLRLIGGGCYDDGGAYWGSPANVYCAMNGEFQDFTRAESRADAKAYFKKNYPLIKWIN